MLHCSLTHFDRCAALRLIATDRLLQVGEDAIKLDANNMGAGKSLVFTLELLNIQRADE